MTVVPLVSLALALVALYYYPIDGEKRAHITATLSQRRGEAR
jgi:Na+/melibiose symporter-like transporter